MYEVGTKFFLGMACIHLSKTKTPALFPLCYNYRNIRAHNTCSASQRQLAMAHMNVITPSPRWQAISIRNKTTLCEARVSTASEAETASVLLLVLAVRSRPAGSDVRFLGVGLEKCLGGVGTTPGLPFPLLPALPWQQEPESFVGLGDTQYRGSIAKTGSDNRFYLVD